MTMGKKDFNEAFAERLRQDRNDLVMLDDFEKKVARILFPGIDVWHEWTPEGRNLVRRQAVKMRELYENDVKVQVKSLDFDLEKHLDLWRKELEKSGMPCGYRDAFQEGYKQAILDIVRNAMKTNIKQN